MVNVDLLRVAEQVVSELLSDFLVLHCELLLLKLLQKLVFGFFLDVLRHMIGVDSIVYSSKGFRTSLC